MKNYEASFKRILAGLLVFCLMLIFVISSSCDADIEVDQTVEQIESATPIISSFSPTSAEILEEILVEGEFLQFVDRATIGGIPTQIKSRVSDTQILLSVDPAVVSGPIVLINDLSRQGAENLEFTATSTESLTVSYPVPSVTSTIPSEATANDLLIMEGSNLGVVSSVIFGGVPGEISFQENDVIVITIPNPGTLDPVSVSLTYNSNTGQISQELSSSFLVNIPTPEPSNVPRIMTRDNMVTITGNNINFTTSVTIDGIEAEITTSATVLTFMVPSGVTTGISEVIITDTEMRQTIFNIPYIDGEYIEMVDMDVTSLDSWELDTGSCCDPLATHEVVEDPTRQPTIPDSNGNPVQFGNGFYRVNYGTIDGSTVSRLNVEDVVNSSTTDRLANLFDGTSFNGNPVLHFFMRTEDSPTFRLYIGTDSNPRRELQSNFRNTGGEWRLIAVALNDFVTGSGRNPAKINFRPSPSSSSSQPAVKFAEYDWFIITDRVLTEFGALDYTDTSSTEMFWRPE
ncbi:hypothetical protein [uncultured Aquimarina sp.]|uniref:hypothetical protein n=1 Tax=uncultured Aquimarina sp. TaxID=575652 RepID=UPI00263568B7|nr:hypothetical protein [uncultured Aquimarina sp.]